VPNLTTKKLSIAIIFSSLFVVLSLFPIGTIFIGGNGRFQLSIMLPPMVGWLLGPYYGIISMVLGSIIGTFFFPSSPFGLLSFIIPATGAFFAGLNKKGIPYLTALYLAFFSFYFVVVYPSLYWFIAPHIIAAIFSILLFFFSSSRVGVFLNVFSSTFAQQATGTILTILLLQVKTESYYMIFPLMIYERSIAIIGSFLLILAVKNRLKSYITL